MEEVKTAGVSSFKLYALEITKNNIKESMDLFFENISISKLMFKRPMSFLTTLDLGNLLTLELRNLFG